MSAGGSVASSDSRFERTGTAETTSFRDLTNRHENLFDQALQNSRPRDGITSNINSMLNQRVKGHYSNDPTGQRLQGLWRPNMPSQAQPAQKQMTQQATRDVYSPEYADNTFNRYAAEVQKAMGMAKSGPAMTRGGTAAQGFAQSEAVNDLALNREQVLTQNRNTDAGIAQGAAGQLVQGRSAMDQTALNALQSDEQSRQAYRQGRMSAAGLASERSKMFNDLVPAYTALSSVMRGTESNDLKGRGAQTSQSMGAGLNVCCFIFMEAYNGEMPKHVRECRDEFAPESSARREGYISMSRWLVPAMRTNGFVRTLVNHLLIKPLTRWGAWYKGVPGGTWSMTDALARKFWFGVWELIGKTK